MQILFGAALQARPSRPCFPGTAAEAAVFIFSRKIKSFR